MEESWSYPIGLGVITWLVLSRIPLEKFSKIVALLIFYGVLALYGFASTFGIKTFFNVTAANWVPALTGLFIYQHQRERIGRLSKKGQWIEIGLLVLILILIFVVASIRQGYFAWY